MQRRSFLKGGAATLSAMLMANSLHAAPRRKKLKHFIYVNLKGGPSQMELWDPKPGNGNGGPTKTVKTKVDNLLFAEPLQGLADISNNMAVIRTTSRIGEHTLGQYYVSSGGFGPNPVIKHPGMCSVVGWGHYNENNDLPPVVSLGAAQSAGFLGNNFDPYVVGGNKLAVTGHDKDALERADNMRDEYYKVSPLAKSDDFNEEVKHESRSSRLSLGISNTVFDIAGESQKTKDAYGTGFGQNCLKTRRLLMAGVPAVHMSLGGWDTHQNNFTKCTTLATSLNQGLSQLVKELKALDLFDQTLIMVAGEFGRTPKINANEGRDHYPQNTPVALISGGLNGLVVGQSGSDGTKMENAVPMSAVSYSVYKLMGIRPKGYFEDITGRPLRYCPGDAGLPGLS